MLNFHRTIGHSNVLDYADELANAVGERREEVKTVLEATGLASVVKRLNKGIETPLGKLDPEGVDVSGGEWQLLAIARGLLKDACIYVLDEPTASIDPMREVEIYQILSLIHI